MIGKLQILSPIKCMREKLKNIFWIFVSNVIQGIDFESASNNDSIFLWNIYIQLVTMKACNTY